MTSNAGPHDITAAIDWTAENSSSDGRPSLLHLYDKKIDHLTLTYCLGEKIIKSLLGHPQYILWLTSPPRSQNCSQQEKMQLDVEVSTPASTDFNI